MAIKTSGCEIKGEPMRDRKSTRLNSSHVSISYAVFCLLFLLSFPTRRSSDLFVGNFGRWDTNLFARQRTEIGRNVGAVVENQAAGRGRSGKFAQRNLVHGN